MNHVSALKHELKEPAFTPSHSYRSSGNYLSALALLLLFVTLFSACPVYDQWYFEVPLGKDRLTTNIRIEGYVPNEGEKLPILLYYLDDTFDYGFINDTGEVVLDDKEHVNTQGKMLYRLYLRDAEKSILLGRKSDEVPILLKVDAAGEVRFREKIPNPKDGGALYTPIATVEEFISIGLNDETRSGFYLLTHELDMLGSPSMPAPRHNWAPIGGMNTTNIVPSNGFMGKFDGGGKKISNLYINRTSGAHTFIGLFGFIDNNAGLRNIVIASGSVQGYMFVGGIAGDSANNSQISDCSNAARVTASYAVGGISGGIGYSAGITGCVNSGAVTGEISHAGGIAGDVLYGASITDCVNSGAVGRGRDIGGIFGSAGYGASITGCVNSGAVSGEISHVGGISGNAAYGVSITGCVNSGTVTGAGGHVGGISATTAYDSSITDCVNSGAVTGGFYVGGIAGFSEGTANITRCYNEGGVTGTDSRPQGPTGGVVGIIGHTLDGIYREPPSGLIEACYNTGTVTGKYWTGGIVGYNWVDMFIVACYNTGRVEGKNAGLGADSAAGGIAGYSTGWLIACYNTGPVLIDENSPAGGVLGKINSQDGFQNSAQYCYWLDLSGSVTRSANAANSLGSTAFGAGWPSNNNAIGWGVGTNSDGGYYWKSLGSWNDGSPVFPKLYWEGSTPSITAKKEIPPYFQRENTGLPGKNSPLTLSRSVQ